MKAIQILDSFDNGADAIESLDFQRVQEGYLGGRVYVVDDPDRPWKMQAFMGCDDCPEWLPDGMRIVTIPDCIMHELGIVED